MMDDAMLERARRLLAAGLTLYDVADDTSWIRCHLCGATSHNANDAEHRYCARCHVFLDDVLRVVSHSAMSVRA